MGNRLNVLHNNKCPLVTVVIVNWNGEQFLERCLSALHSQTVVPHDIILVDNASSDNSLDIARRYPSVRSLMQRENLGFARGNNLAINSASPQTEWIALVNPDAFVEPDWLERLISATKSYPDVTAFGSRQVRHSAPEILDGIGDVYHISGLVWRNGNGRVQSSEDDIAGEIFSPCACAALFRRDALIEVGGFDEDYFCYVEDVDLGFRLRLAGFKARYVPDAIVHHVGSGASGGRHSNFSIYHGYRNVVWTFVKDMPGVLFWILLPVHLASMVLAVLRFSKQGQGKVILRAEWDAIKGIPKAWRKRRKIQAHRRASVSDIWRALDKKIPILLKTN